VNRVRIFTATLGTETSTFSPLPTGLESFRETLLWRPGEHPDHPTEVTAPLWAARERARADGWEVIEGTCAFAQPAGITSRRAYETLRDEILGQLRRAGAVDIVALGLHGAMLAHGYPDCEADLLQRVRTIVGPGTAIGALLDPHCHLTDAKMRAADVLVLFKEYPHTDYVERARELLTLLEHTARREVRPTMAMHDCRMLAAFVTTDDPVRRLVDRMRALEGEEGVLSVSLAHGFPAGDTPDTGTRTLVVTDNAPELAQSIARQLGHAVDALRPTKSVARPALEDCLLEALASTQRPVVVADAWDNCGSGDPGDATAVLRWLIQHQSAPACLGPFWDPQAVGFCFEAGEAATLALRIGGKCGAASGEPLDVQVEVLRLDPAASQTYHGVAIPLGPSALIRIGTVEVVLNSQRQQALSPDLFTRLGVDLASMALIVVKSAQQFRPAFADVAARTVILRHREGGERRYVNVRRPIWPLDAGASERGPLPPVASAREE
jgi:microcystin degradation protein MlrC